jgi:hypothetical protein
LVGISNKRNLIFRLNNEEFKVSPKGSILWINWYTSMV